MDAPPPSSSAAEETPADLTGCERILVIGCSGAGKSTFARKLGAATGIEVQHLEYILDGTMCAAASRTEARAR